MVGERHQLQIDARHPIRIQVAVRPSLLQQLGGGSSPSIYRTGVEFLAINDEQELLLNASESTFIPAGHRHRLENPGAVDMVLIEVQTGSYLGEDDIVRFEDRYGRG